MNIRIQGGLVVDPANHIQEHLTVDIVDNRILAVTPEGMADFTPETVMDATGMVVAPGLVDLCARLREPGFEDKATIASEVRAAARGGITTLCCPPDTNPVIDTPAVTELIRRRAKDAGYVHVLTLGALTQGLTGEILSEMAALKEAGCVGVSNGYQTITNVRVLRQAMEYAATFDLTVYLTPVDAYLQEGGYVHEGSVATRLGLPGIPEAAETVAIARDLELIAQTGARAHFCRLSTARAVKMIEYARSDNIPVTADVASHQLFLTEEDLCGFNPVYHVLPPLRTQRDKEGLRLGLQRGIIQAICSDHQPHESDAKSNPFPATEPGISSLETLLPLTLRLVEENLLTLEKALATVTIEPARILGIPAGTLSPGASADLCIFSLGSHLVDAEKLISRGRHTPFHGWTLPGEVFYTLQGGRVVFGHKKIG